MYRRALIHAGAAARRAASVAPAAMTRPLASSSSSRIILSQAQQRRGSLAAFSTSSMRGSHGESDAALVSKLASELQYEQESASQDGDSVPEFLEAFQSTGIWTIEDKAGADEISLTRKFGNENIKILFSIADIDNNPSNTGGMLSSDNDGQSGEAAADPNAEADAVEAQGPSLPIRCAITVSKGKGQGALTIDAVAQDGMFLVDNISLYNDEALALDLTSEADWNRRGLYMGPAFDHLDESLQTDFESFLEERGIDSNLALFIPDLAEYKEQKEYVKWLEGVKKFVEA